MRWPGVAALTLALPLGGAVASASPTDGCAQVPPDARQRAALIAPTSDFDRPEPCEAFSGGAASVIVVDPRHAFEHPAAGLDAGAALDFISGQALFRKIWVAAPASTRASDGLGPFYNARACAACHPGNGRGHPPETTRDQSVSLVLHLAVPGPDGDALPEPVYGWQLQVFATAGLLREGALQVVWHEFPVALTDGTEVSLRRPEFRATDLTLGPFAPDTMRSARIAPPIVGLGLLAVIPAENILAREDSGDTDGDGVSGRANIVPGPDGHPALGRFGWKAGVASLRQQTALAFATDLGLSTPDMPAPWGDCTKVETACRTAPHGDHDTRGTEVGTTAFALVSAYAGNIAVPQRRDVGAPQVLAGKRIFHSIGCAACHQPKQFAAPDRASVRVSGQVIWPYTDLLLHDMGPGLADGFAEGRASGREWRTPPLWGIGLTREVSGGTTFLHDGRARSLLEAVLWHGGEAQSARDAVAALPAPDRDALIRFLESL